VLTSLGQTYADASILARKEIMAGRVLRLPVISWIYETSAPTTTDAWPKSTLPKNSSPTLGNTPGSNWTRPSTGTLRRTVRVRRRHRRIILADGMTGLQNKKNRRLWSNAGFGGGLLSAVSQLDHVQVTQHCDGTVIRGARFGDEVLWFQQYDSG